MAKRKAASQLDSGSSKRRQQTSSASRHAKPYQVFRFLDLPAELRTKILLLAASDNGTGLLSRRSRGKLSSADGVGMVSKQLREEYLAALYGFAATILIEVLDFDFRHIVTFFNKLHAGEIRALPISPSEKPQSTSDEIEEGSGDSGEDSQDEQPEAEPLPAAMVNKRVFKVILDMTPTCSATPHYLERWLNRMEVKEKTGANAVIQYVAASRMAVKQWRTRCHWNLLIERLPWPERQKEALDKMRTAMASVCGDSTVYGAGSDDEDDDSEMEDQDGVPSWLDDDRDLEWSGSSRDTFGLIYY